MVIIMEENLRILSIELMKRHLEPRVMMEIRNPLMDSQAQIRTMTIWLQNNREATLEEIKKQAKIIKEKY